MKRLLLAVISFSLCVTVFAKQPPKVREDTILVKPKKGVAVADMAALHKQLGAKAKHTFQAIGNLQIVRLPRGVSVEQAIEHYLKSGLAEYAEPDTQVQAVDCNPSSSPPDDPYYLNGTLWNLHNYGQSYGRCGADISAAEGWQKRTSMDDIVVAIIDTGTRYTHEDLAANMWRNPGETGIDTNGLDKATNGADDDGDGIVDDVYGARFIDGVASGDPMDDHYHGTHVAGIIAGAGDNAAGICGVAWSGKLMAVKFISANGSGWTSDAILAIDYARRMGAKVLNNSWGCNCYEQSMLDTIRSTRDAGMIFVAAAGNNMTSNDDDPFYPASYEVDNVIAVAATDSYDSLAVFSNWGANTVHLGAPGSNIYSCNRTSDSSYMYLSGTSMASPHVAAVCALVWAQFPYLSYSNVIQRVLRGVDYIDSMASTTITGGRLNYARSVNDPLADFDGQSTTQQLTVAFTDRSIVSDSNYPITQSVLDFGDGHIATNLVTLNYVYAQSGIYTATLTVRNSIGATSSKTRKVTALGPTYQMSVSPGDAFYTEGDYGGTFNPPSKTYTLRNTGNVPLTWIAYAQNDWVLLSATSGTLPPGTATNVTIAVNAATAPPGYHETSFSFVNTSTGQGSTTRTASMVVHYAGGLVLTPEEELNCAGEEGGPFTPSSKNYVLQNTTGSFSFNWGSEVNDFWIDVSPAYGTVGPGESVPVTLSLNQWATTLQAGTNENWAWLWTDVDPICERAVTLDATQTLFVTPEDTFISQGTEGGEFTPESITYTLFYTGQNPLNWVAATNNNWLSTSPESGTLTNGGSVDVTVSLNGQASDLPAGVWYASVVFTNADNGHGYQWRSSQTVVQEGTIGTLNVTPEDGYFLSGPAGGPFTPASKTYTLSYTNGTPLHWQATHGNALLAATPSSGVLHDGESVDVTIAPTPFAYTWIQYTFTSAVSFVARDINISRQTIFTIIPGHLDLNPAWAFVSTGPQGGPFSLTNRVYTLTWSGSTPLPWVLSNGVPWLTISPTSGTLSNQQPINVTASVNSLANAMPPGSNKYDFAFCNAITGYRYVTMWSALIVTQQTGTITVTPSDAFSSSGVQGGPFTPASKTYTLHYEGSQPYQWQAIPNSDWFFAWPDSGTLNSGQSVDVTVYIDVWADDLEPGLYEEDIAFGNYNVTSVPIVHRGVNLDVSSAGTLSLSPSTGLTSSGTQGGPFSPASLSYVLVNSGGQTITWSANNSQSWVSLSPTSGTLGYADAVMVTVSINANANSLATGNYSDTVNFVNTFNGNGNTSRAVALTVNATAALSVTPAGGLTSSGTQGGPFSPSSTTYTLQNTGGQTINWTASKSQSWVTLSATSGSLAGGASTNVSVSINSGANSLAAGNYSDTISFINTSTGSGNTTRAVALTVNAPGNLSVSPSGGLSSSGLQGGPFSPPSQTYTLQNTGSVSINWTASKTAAWTTLSASSGVLGPGAWTTVDVTINVNANSLAAGSYSDTVSFTNTSNGNGNTTRNVSLTVNAPANLSVTPAGSLTSSGTQGGPFSPSSQLYTLQNTGSVTMNWTASKTATWVTLSAASGTLGAGASTNITVSINTNANTLAAGGYSDTVSFANTSNGNGNTTRNVSLTVNAPANLSVTPAGGLTSSGTQGGPFSPSSQLYTLQNTGSVSMNWTASKTATWVTLSAASGTLGAGASTNLTVSINTNANTLAAGSYSDTVSFTNVTNGAGNTTRAVSLTVNAAPGTLSVTPANSLSSSGYTGGPFVPSNQVYMLQNTGGFAINWRASKTAAWTTLSITNGALNAGASTNVTVSINTNANSLAAGSYSDSVTFTNTSNGNGSTNRAVSLTVSNVVLNAPTSLTATQLTSNSVLLNWVDNSSGETGDAVERATKSGNNFGSFSQIGTSGANSTTFTNSAVAKGTYRYRVRAFRGTTYSPYSSTTDISVK